MKKLKYLLFLLTTYTILPAQTQSPMNWVDQKWNTIVALDADTTIQGTETAMLHADSLWQFYQKNPENKVGELAAFFTFATYLRRHQHEKIFLEFEQLSDKLSPLWWKRIFELWRKAIWKNYDGHPPLIERLIKLEAQSPPPYQLATIYENIGEWSYYIPEIDQSRTYFKKLQQLPEADSLQLIKAKTFLYELDSLSIGNKAPDFEYLDHEGKPFKLSNLKGKVVLLDFWATWCGPCVASLPDIKALYDRFHSSGQFEIVGVSLDSDIDRWKSFLSKNDLPWTQICEGKRRGGEIVRLYNAMGIPKYYIIDQKGIIQYNPLSSKSGQDFTPTIETLLKSKHK